MSTRYDNGSHYESHQRAEELQDGAAHAHRVGEQHAKQEHPAGHEHSARRTFQPLPDSQSVIETAMPPNAAYVALDKQALPIAHDEPASPYRPQRFAQARSLWRSSSFGRLANRLQQAGSGGFVESWNNLRECIESKVQTVRTGAGA